MRNAIVLLSGGMDSAVAFMWALKNYDHVEVMTFNYGQVAVVAELAASTALFAYARVAIGGVAAQGHGNVVKLPGPLLASKASILGRSEINQYETVEDAVQNTPNDRSYIPLRNALFITIAAHHLLARNPSGGAVVVGVRSRSDPGAPAGYPDCTSEFAGQMSEALSVGAGQDVLVADPLNKRAVPSREDTIRYALELYPDHAMEMLARTVTCFSGDRCGKCLPCQRRKQAFEAVGIDDPAAGFWMSGEGA